MTEQLEAQVVHRTLADPCGEERLGEAQNRGRGQDQEVHGTQDRETPERVVAADLAADRRDDGRVDDELRDDRRCDLRQRHREEQDERDDHPDLVGGEVPDQAPCQARVVRLAEDLVLMHESAAAMPVRHQSCPSSSMRVRCRWKEAPSSAAARMRFSCSCCSSSTSSSSSRSWRRYMLAYKPARSRSAWCVPRSAMRPSARTRISSASFTVEIRCATTMLVRSRITPLSRLRISASV